MKTKHNEPIFYVYVYLDPTKPGRYIFGEYTFDHAPFYVGKGHGKRSTKHLTEYNLKVNSNKLFVNTIKKIQRTCGHDPFIIPYKDNISEQSALELEVSMILTIGRKNLHEGPLCNLTNGGDGQSGFVFSSDMIEKMSKSHIGHIPWNKGKTGVYTKETLDNWSNTRQGKKHTEETKEKMIKSRTGQKRGKYKTISNTKMWQVIYPDGVTEMVDGLKNFCRENDLPYMSMYRNQFVGWSCQKVKNLIL